MDNNTKKTTAEDTGSPETTRALQQEAIARWVNEGGAGADAQATRRIQILWGTKLNQAPLRSSVGRTRWMRLKRIATMAWHTLLTVIRRALTLLPQPALVPVRVVARPRARVAQRRQSY